jgi:hypothetical protein
MVYIWADIGFKQGSFGKIKIFENSGHLGWSLIPLYILERGIPKDYSG